MECDICKNPWEIMDNKTPLYNSRIIKVYLEYLSKSYPDIDLDEALSYAGIKAYEVSDLAHCFNQDQVDRFNQFISKKTKISMFQGKRVVMQLFKINRTSQAVYIRPFRAWRSIYAYQ